MNIFLRELKSNLRSLLIWGVIVILFIWIGISKFAAYEGQPRDIGDTGRLAPGPAGGLQFRCLQPDHGQPASLA